MDRSVDRPLQVSSYSGVLHWFASLSVLPLEDQLRCKREEANSDKLEKNQPGAALAAEISARSG